MLVASFFYARFITTRQTSEYSFGAMSKDDEKVIFVRFCCDVMVHVIRLHYHLLTLLSLIGCSQTVKHMQLHIKGVVIRLFSKGTQRQHGDGSVQYRCANENGNNETQHLRSSTQYDFDKSVSVKRIK